MIENDSNSEVRRAVLSCIAPSAKTLPQIVGRTKDVKEAVRKLAYQVNKPNNLCRHILKILLKNIWYIIMISSTSVDFNEIFMDGDYR